MPRKLRLDLDRLHVDSFATGGTYGQRTVLGYATTALQDTCWGCAEYSDEDTCAGGGAPTLATCAGQASCPKSACGPTCGPTMWQSCLTCEGISNCGVTPCSPCTA